MVPPPVQNPPRRRFPWWLLVPVLILLFWILSSLYHSGGERRSADLDQATARARAELPTFVEALNHRTASQRFFVRAAFGPKSAKEILWVRGIVYDKGNFRGRLDQSPSLLRDVKKGDDVVVKPDDVYDWAIKDGDEIRGRYTEQITRD